MASKRRLDTCLAVGEGPMNPRREWRRVATSAAGSGDWRRVVERR